MLKKLLGFDEPENITPSFSSILEKELTKTSLNRLNVLFNNEQLSDYFKKSLIIELLNLFQNLPEGETFNFCNVAVIGKDSKNKIYIGDSDNV